MEQKKTTLVLGASVNPSRYAYLAIHRLVSHGQRVLPIGLKEGVVAGVSIKTGMPEREDIDTITLYLNAGRQKAYYSYLLSLQPRRIIFNPGAENQELETLARAAGIEILNECTLVMLATGQY